MKYNISKLSHDKKGKSHWNHKGDKVGYKAFHLRVTDERGKTIVCINCGASKNVEWANLSGKYQDIYDYISLCRRCHHKLDGQNFKRAKTLGKIALSKISIKGWKTRRKVVVPR